MPKNRNSLGEDSSPLVSIIIPNHNNSELLVRAVESCLKSRGVNIEVVIVDDCSSDQSHAAIKGLADTDQRIKPLLLRENKGPLQARIIGLEESRGELIVFLDSDDEIVPAAFKQIVEEHIARNVDITIAGYMKSPSGKGVLPEGGIFQSDRDFRHFFWTTSFKYLWGKVYKRRIVESVTNELAWLPFRHNEDVVANYLMIYRNNDLKVLCRPINMFIYHCNDNSITQTKKFSNFLDGYNAIAWIENDLVARGNSPSSFSAYFFSKIFDLAKTEDARLGENWAFILLQCKKHFESTAGLSRKNRCWLFVIRRFGVSFSFLVKIRRWARLRNMPATLADQVDVNYTGNH